MADVRSLLKSEQQSRRINHPHLSYTKSGQLNCTVCNLIIKSSSLWEGHLKSSNHRKNTQSLETTSITQSKKRKNDDDDTQESTRQIPIQSTDDEKMIIDRPKKRVKSVKIIETPTRVMEYTDPIPEVPTISSEPIPTQPAQPSEPIEPTTQPTSTIDEDEWAAFEREVAPLTQDEPKNLSSTIIAEPILASEIIPNDQENKKPSKQIEAEEEKEEEERRLEEEMDIMEEMETKIRRLKEKREALRRDTPHLSDQPIDQQESTSNTNQNDDDDDDDDEEDYDDWGFR